MTSELLNLQARYETAFNTGNLELADQLAAEIIVLKRALKS